MEVYDKNHMLEQVFIKLQLGKESGALRKDLTVMAMQLHLFPFCWTWVAGPLEILDKSLHQGYRL